MSLIRCRFVLCFLTRADQVLMLLRNRPPNQGLWNGIGGHIEPDETPLAACLREVREETGYALPSARFGGVLTWEGFEIEPGGLVLFTAEAPAGEPVECNEGQLAWQPQGWACTAPQVVGNLHVVLPRLLRGEPPQTYHFRYSAGQMLGWAQGPAPADMMTVEIKGA